MVTVHEDMLTSEYIIDQRLNLLEVFVRSIETITYMRIVTTSLTTHPHKLSHTYSYPPLHILQSVCL